MSHFRPWPYPRVLAHRGGGTLAPENTLAALRFGRELGFRAAEFDAMLAGDAVPVLIHDPTLERTTSGAGPVDRLPAAALAQLDAGSWHSPRFAGEPVPQLDAVLGWCRAHELWLNVEIKPAPGAAARTGTAVASTVAHAYADCLAGGVADDRAPLLSSFEPDALAAAHAAVPALRRGLLIDRVPDDWPARLAALDAVALHTNHRHLTAALARAVKAAGYWLFCYTVDEPARARELFAWGVDAFCTDRLDRIGPRFAEENAP